MTQTDIEKDFKLAVRAARYKLKMLMMTDRRSKIFALVPDIEWIPTRIRRWTGSRFKYEHLRKRIAKTLRTGRQLPANLDDIAADMVEGRRPKFKKQKRTDLIIVIGMAVDAAAEHVRPYRNEAAEHYESANSRQSACDAVVKAASQLRLRLAGRLLTYNSVSHRYRQYVQQKGALSR